MTSLALPTNQGLLHYNISDFAMGLQPVLSSVMEITMRSMMFAAVLMAAAAIMPHPAAAAEKIKVVAAENFYGDLASKIGGEHVEVTSILSNPEDDPHLFESSPSTARALSTAATGTGRLPASATRWITRRVS